MMIGGAGLSLIGVLVLDREARLSVGDTGTRPKDTSSWLLKVGAAGALVIGLSAFQGEYDFGVEQFRLVLQPMMITGAAALALVAARMLLGRGGAVLAALFFLLLRGIISVLVGPGLGEPQVWFPLYLSEAIIVEAVALTRLTRKPLALGAVSGLGIATLGMALESLWINQVFAVPWAASIWAEALAMCIPVGVATGMCGALLATALRDGHLPRPALSRGIVTATALIVAAATANGLSATVPDNATATIALREVSGTGAARTAAAEVRVTPASLAQEDAAWVEILAWQGGGAGERGLVIDRLKRTGPGTYESIKPIPIAGGWKSTLRVQDGRTMTAVPIYLPAEDAIDAEEVPASATFTRQFVPEITLLQRERSFDHPAWLWGAASVVVLACSVALIWALSWGVARLARSSPGRDRNDAGDRERVLL